VAAPAAPERTGAARSRPDLILLALAVVAGAAVRLIGLGSVGLNSDEAVYASQAGSLVGNPRFTELFPIVRAHPLLFQIVISPLYSGGTPTEAGRYVSAAFGIATIVVVYAIGRVMFRPVTGSVAALILAVMPYHVVISRQILLDGPMTFFVTLALLAMALAGRTGRGRYLVAAGAAIGIAALCKEPAAVMVGALLAFVALSRSLWHPLRYPIIAAVLALALTVVYPLLTALSGGSTGGQSYLAWQLTRPPNHDAGFYPVVVAGSIGFVVIGAALAGLLIFWRIGWQGRLLVAWVAVPVAFFEVWPIQGFSYLMPVTPALALLAARTVDLIATTGIRPKAPAGTDRARVVAVGLAVLVAAVCILLPAFISVRSVTRSANSGLAGDGGTPGARAAAQWIGEHAPIDAAVMTIGPSMANIVQFYGHRPADGLSVSPNPLHRNPTYHPIVNANAALHEGKYQYVVWDAYSARRSPNFGTRAEQLVQRFGGQPVDVQRGTFRGQPDQPLVVVYELTPSHAATPSARPAVVQPSRAVLYAGYGVAFVIALGISVAAVASERRTRPAKDL
jgi:4-amino-4-deoxy-L-arabinose transferase-like glycosyltransferase